jgi:hypothetical protein
MDVLSDKNAVGILLQYTGMRRHSSPLTSLTHNEKKKNDCHILSHLCLPEPIIAHDN